MVRTRYQSPSSVVCGGFSSKTYMLTTYSLQEHVLPQPSTMASIHPSLRDILDVPETAPPRPRPGLRPQNHGPTRARRIPGPPPPKSWLSQSKHAPKQRHEADNTQRVQHQSIKLPESYLVDEKSLQHKVLKALALNWNWHAEYDHLYLTQIPLRLRETLLSYLSIYKAGEDGLSNPLRVLFPAVSTLEEDETEEVRRIDLTNALGRWLSFQTLRRTILLTERTSSHTDSDMASHSINPIVSENVPDSWEDESEQRNEHQHTRTIRLPKTLHAARFPNLRHLSLALDPTVNSSAVSWSGLLSIASHLQTLESLSLAYWPLPTYTPQAAATYATVSTNIMGLAQRVVYGGTNMYSALHNDWRESSGILKSLSRSLYCLKWLDLTGCTAWLPALVWEDTALSTSIMDQFESNIDRFEKNFSHSGTEETSVSVWNGYWRGVVWLGLSVGWTPNGSSNPDGRSTIPVSGEYTALRKIVDNVAKQVRQKRLAGKGQPITIDCGESQTYTGP